MKRIVLLGILLVLFVSGCVKSPPPPLPPLPCTVESYQPLVVKITAKFSSDDKEYGFGFIVGESGNDFYIITANHVIGRKLCNKVAEKIFVRFFQGEEGEAKVVQQLSSCKPDIALLKIEKDATSWAENAIHWDARSCTAWCSNWEKDQQIWFIGNPSTNEDSWKVQPSVNRKAIILDSSEKQSEFIVFDDFGSVQRGTSGAPVITKGGIVGMIVEDNIDNAIALRLDSIKYFVEENGGNWNLRKKARCSIIDDDIVKIIYNDSTQDLAQRINKALTAAGFKVETKDFSAFASYVREHLSRNDRPDGIEDKNLFFYSNDATESMVVQAVNIVRPFLQDSGLTNEFVPEEYIAEGLTIKNGKMLLMLNESRSWFNQLFN